MSIQPGLCCLLSYQAACLARRQNANPVWSERSPANWSSCYGHPLLQGDLAAQHCRLGQKLAQGLRFYCVHH